MSRFFPMSHGAVRQTISHVARAAGVNVETVRYYQRCGLVGEPPKPWRGYRVYPVAAVARIRFIKRAQELGFTLAEIKSLLALGDEHCPETRLLAEHKLEQIEDRIRDLNAMRGDLRRLVDSCKAHGEMPGCPLVRSIARH
jgi:MerR family mercuric resistance operon transcriptional regulator